MCVTVCAGVHCALCTPGTGVGGEADEGVGREASGLGASVRPHPSFCAHAEALTLWERLSLVGPLPSCSVGPVGWGPGATWLQDWEWLTALPSLSRS